MSHGSGSSLVPKYRLVRFDFDGTPAALAGHGAEKRLATMEEIVEVMTGRGASGH